MVEAEADYVLNCKNLGLDMGKRSEGAELS